MAKQFDINSPVKIKRVRKIKPNQRQRLEAKGIPSWIVSRRVLKHMMG